MKQVIAGEDITFTNTFLSSGVPTDPDADAVLKIVKSVTAIVLGPFSWLSGDLTKTGTGTFTRTITIDPALVPGVYTARWEATIAGDDQVIFEDFQVIEEPVENQDLLDPPRKYGIIRETSLGRNMGNNTTDRIFLIGHANGLSLNSPYQVRDMRDAVNIMQADANSPLLRGMLEAYNAGARDIWLVAAAPLREYVDFSPVDTSERFVARTEFGGLNFYEKYAERLEATYEALLDYDPAEIIVPLEAPFYDTGGVDFLTPLVHHCEDAYHRTGAVRLGIIGTRMGSERSDADVTAMVNDSRLTAGFPKQHVYDEDEDLGNDLSSGGKFVMIITGEGSFKLPQMPVAHSSSLAASAAGAISHRRWDRGLTHVRLQNVIGLINTDLTEGQVQRLARAGVNSGIRTIKGRRGQQNQVVIASDNMLAEQGSDFWSLVQIRLLAKVLERVRALGNRFMGSVGFDRFKDDVESFLVILTRTGYIRDYRVTIQRDQTNRYGVLVDVTLFPYAGVREIFFTVEVGPGEQ